MKRRYNRCHFCGGRVTERLIVIDYRWGDQLLAIIEKVPAGVCEVCGKRYFKAAIVKAMEHVAHSRTRTQHVARVPIRELKVA